MGRREHQPQRECIHWPVELGRQGNVWFRAVLSQGAQIMPTGPGFSQPLVPPTQCWLYSPQRLLADPGVTLPIPEPQQDRMFLSEHPG